MKVLFAVSNEKISEVITKRYPTEYKEILSYKNVYYFNAILKEIQKDKSYDRIIISEDLEPFVNTNHDSIDNFIFEHLDRISDEAHDNEGKETSIILICSERRTPGSAILNKLFSIGVYNAVMGNDRNVTELCKLINRPRTKKEAKVYYRLEQVSYDPVVENEVNEVEIQNILSHFKKLGKNTERYADSFNNIAAQYTDEQLKIIINVLPIKVKAVLESDSPKYQSLMGASGDNRINPLKSNEPGIKVNTIGKAGNINGPIVIPSNVKKIQPRTSSSADISSVVRKTPTTSNNRVNQPQTRKNVQSATNIAKSVVPNTATTKLTQQPNLNTVANQPVNKTQSNTQPASSMVAKKIPTVDVAQNEVVNNVQSENLTNKVAENTMDFSNLLEDLNNTPQETQAGEVKRGRGRPKKLESENSIDDKPKGKRGRPPKTLTPEPPETVDLNSLLNPNTDDSIEDSLPGLDETPLNEGLPGLDDMSADEGLPGLDDIPVNEDLPGLDDTSVDEGLPGLDDSLPGLDNNSVDNDFSGLNESSNSLSDLGDSSIDEGLPGLDDELGEDSLPGLDEMPIDEGLPGLDNNSLDDGLPGLDDSISGSMNNEGEDVDVNSLLAGLDDDNSAITNTNVVENIELPGLDDMSANDGLSEFDDNLPGLDNNNLIDDSINGLDDDGLPGLDDAISSLDNLDNSNESVLPGMGFEDTTSNNSFFGNDDSHSSDIVDTVKPQYNYSMSNLNSLLSQDKKIVAFVGTTKNGTSFLVNNLALMLSVMGIDTAILDMTQNRNSYYIFTNSREELRNIAYTSIGKLENGYAEGIKVNKKFTVYTALPNDGNIYENAEPILSTLVQNHSLVLIDCDFNTPPAYFASSQEIYLVQTYDILTIQPLTAFLRELKFKNAWEPEKARVVINKDLKVKSLNEKMLVAGMSRYNGPDMTVMTDLFNKDMVKACSIPFDEKVYAKYLESMATCQLSMSSFSKQFMSKMKILGDMVYPRLNSKKSYSPMDNANVNSAQSSNVFSNDMDNTLNQMKNKYK